MRLVLPLFLLLPAYADIQFSAHTMTRSDVASGMGQCDIALQVDDAVEVSLRGNVVSVHNISGRDARDGGSECSAPLPARDFEGFQFGVKEKRNEIRLVAPPTSGNGYQAVVFIRDSASGEGRYRFRISWKLPPPQPPPGMSFNNLTHSNTRGHGKAQIGDRPPMELRNASVDFDRAGKVFVVFTAPQGTPSAFRGSVMSWEGGVMKVDITADDHFDNVRGPMYLYFDPAQQVYKIELKATDGQHRLSLQWERGK